MTKIFQLADYRRAFLLHFENFLKYISDRYTITITGVGNNITNLVDAECKQTDYTFHIVGSIHKAKL